MLMPLAQQPDIVAEMNRRLLAKIRRRLEEAREILAASPSYENALHLSAVQGEFTKVAGRVRKDWLVIQGEPEIQPLADPNLTRTFGS